MERECPKVNAPLPLEFQPVVREKVLGKNCRKDPEPCRLDGGGQEGNSYHWHPDIWQASWRKQHLREKEIMERKKQGQG